MIDVTFTLTEPEFLEAQTLTTRQRRPWEFRKRWVYLAIVVALLVWFIDGNINTLRLLSTGDNLSIGLWHTALSPWLLLINGLIELWFFYVLFDLLTLRGLKRRLKKLYLASRPQLTNTTLKIDGNGWFAQAPANSTTFVEWSGFTDWIEGSSVLVVRRPGFLMQLLPKRALSTSELSEVIDLIKSHIGPALKVPRF